MTKKVMKNQDLRTLMKSKNISQFDIAEFLNVSEMTVFRMLRRDLTGEERKKIKSAIAEIEGER